VPELFSFRHVQGAEAEIREAVRAAVSDLGDGVAPAEIAIVARTLEPWAAAIERALGEAELPWTSSLSAPLRRHPFVRDFLVLLEIADTGFPRSRTAQLLRSPRLRWSAGERPPGERADAWSRRARLLGGIDEWTEHLPRWVGEQGPGRADADDPDRARVAREDAERIARAVRTLADAVPAARAPWSTHARALHELLDARLAVPEHRAADALREIVGEMALLETLLGERAPVPLSEARSWLELAVDACRIPVAGDDTGGIRVLDVMQLRGLTFRRVHLIGMNEGVFPRAPREDAVLPDRVRATLRQATGRPLPLARAGADEERLLLSLAIGAATEHVSVSWQRAEESGKARTPSLALREIVRLATGRPSLDGLLDDPDHHVPSHPEHALRHAVSACGLVSPREERVLAALTEPDPGALAERFPELADGIAMLAATQSFDDAPGAYDGRVGPLDSPPVLAVGSVERLGYCPLQFFFRDVLGVRELDDEASAQRMDGGEMGRNVHDVLHAVYRRLDAEGVLAEPDAGLRIERALAVLDLEIRGLFGVAGDRLRRRLPVLWREQERAWREAIASFLRFDLVRWENTRLVGLEESVRGEIALAEDVRIELSGRYDRRIERGGVTVVCDYKTGANPKELVSPTPMLKGERLQVPLYALLSGGEVEILPVGPKHAAEPTALRFALAEEKDDVRRALGETLAVTARLYAAGCFPCRDNDRCRYCAWVAACRKDQPPTEERETRATDAAAHRALGRRNARKPFATEDEP
jgi:ATP-dependent helicase/nuclease subunit B